MVPNLLSIQRNRPRKFYFFRCVETMYRKKYFGCRQFQIEFRIHVGSAYKIWANDVWAASHIKSCFWRIVNAPNNVCEFRNSLIKFEGLSQGRYWSRTKCQQEWKEVKWQLHLVYVMILKWGSGLWLMRNRFIFVSGFGNLFRYCFSIH